MTTIRTVAPGLSHLRFVTRTVGFAEYNAARHAIARTLDLLLADALEFSVDGSPVVCRNAYGQGAL